MKVHGSGRNQGVGKTSKSSKKSGASATGFDKLISGEADEGSATQGLSGVNPAARIDALLAAQETSDATSEEARHRASQRAGLILDQLELLRMGMLTGVIPVQHLKELSRVVSSHRDYIMDPALMGVLDDIDLRAQVELAKLTYLNEGQKV